MSQSNDSPSENPVFYGHSKRLFTRSCGKPIHFSMRPCAERTEIRGMIEHGGGTINSDAPTNSIRLAKSGSVVMDSRTVDSKYVLACVKENRLLDLGPYYLLREEYASSTDEDEPRIQNSSPKKQSNRKHSRREFTYEEDMEILNHICKHQLHSEIGGNMLWRNMEKQKVLKDRTWHSMSNRFKKTIRNRLANYDIPKSDKMLLEQKTERNRKECWQNKINAFKKREVQVYDSDEIEEEPAVPDAPVIEDNFEGANNQFSESRSPKQLTQKGSPKPGPSGYRRLPPKNQMMMNTESSPDWRSTRKKRTADDASSSKHPEKRTKLELEKSNKCDENVASRINKRGDLGFNYDMKMPAKTEGEVRVKKQEETPKKNAENRILPDYNSKSKQPISADKTIEAEEERKPEKLKENTQDDFFAGFSPKSKKRTRNREEKKHEKLKERVLENKSQSDIEKGKRKSDKLREFEGDRDGEDNKPSWNSVPAEEEESSCNDVIEASNSESTTPELQFEVIDVEEEVPRILTEVREKLTEFLKIKSKVQKNSKDLETEKPVPMILKVVLDKEVKILEVHKEDAKVVETEKVVQGKFKDVSQKQTEEEVSDILKVGPPSDNKQTQVVEMEKEVPNKFSEKPTEVLEKQSEISEKATEKEVEVCENQTTVLETERGVPHKQTDIAKRQNQISDKRIQKVVPVALKAVVGEESKVAEKDPEVCEKQIDSVLGETVREAVETEAKRAGVWAKMEEGDDRVRVVTRFQLLQMRRKEVKDYMVEKVRNNCGGKMSKEMILNILSGTSKFDLIEMMDKDSPRRFQLLDIAPCYFGNPSDNESFDEFL